MSFSFSEPVDIYDEIQDAAAQQWNADRDADDADAADDDERCLHAAFEQAYETALNEGADDVSRAEFAFTEAEERAIAESCPWWDDMTHAEQCRALRSWVEAHS